MSDDEQRQTDRWGIQRRWVDANEETAVVSEATVRRLREAIGEPPDDLEDSAPIVTRPGRDLGLGRVGIGCEDGRTRTVDGRLPEDFPLGYHRVRTAAGRERLLVVSPGRCWLPPRWRAWGWTLQLYATRSGASWGMGDLADLRAVREWAQRIDAGFLLINPLHAVAPTLPQEASPYLPATRRFRNPLYLRVEEVPGADQVELSSCVDRGRRLNGERLIDRDAVWRLKREALEQIHRLAGGGERSGDFERWRTAQGTALQEFAVWCALADEHGPDWRDWPTQLHDPHGAAVGEYAERHPDRVSFHAWLQWLLDVQLRKASGDLPVIQDLPIGVAGGGADAWAWQGTMAAGITVGAPPDAFNSAGQDWGSPPLTPWRLRQAEYRPFIESVRATMAAAGGVRIDHVMGLFRLWWVPDGAGPAEGAYVRYPSEDLLDIVALESHRARSIVVGEDLGTVEPGVREALSEHDMLSYRLLWFEQDDPAEWPDKALAAVTTHDLPTVAGLWSGSDVREQRRYTDADVAELTAGREELLARLRGPAGVSPDATPAEAVAGAHRLLARAPSTLLAATLDDAVAEEQRPNIPGVVDRDNWSLSLPVPVEDLPEHPTATALAGILRDAVRRPPAQG
ncbi:MAG TPA: 4-alpha-glucanotransferase [Nocardioidaceae bacterium]|nr:4-alpha-glucanotransferase [Nocardioidaceae bacterium]